MAFTKRWKYPTKTGGGRDARLLRIYQEWYNINRRCSDIKDKSYEYYGGRGISVCDEWKSYDNFYEWAMENGYRDDLTIDRIEVNGNYEPNNCRWITRKEQMRNTRKNVYIDGKCLSQIAEEHNLPVGRVVDRYSRGHKTIEELLTPVNELRVTRRADGKTLTQIAKENGLDVNTVRERWKRGDRTYERLSRKV